MKGLARYFMLALTCVLGVLTVPIAAAAVFLFAITIASLVTADKLEGDMPARRSRPRDVIPITPRIDQLRWK